MKLAKDVITTMAAHPNVEFSMRDIVQRAVGHTTGKERQAQVKAIYRVLLMLIENGTVVRTCSEKNYCKYVWI